ncbi:MAG: c-type cytochrome domain-containing protein [Verrucomicrobiota bacterium]
MNLTTLKKPLPWKNATPLALALAAVATVLPSIAAENKSVSYFNDVVPIFKKSCNGCHHPGKLKGKLDLTTFEGLQKGGKTGPGFVPGDPRKSLLVEEISGEEPSMPKEGDPLSAPEIALIEQWIKDGAKDDTPEDKRNPFKLAAPPVYSAPPVISALAYSADGKTLAISGYHEVILHKADGSEIIARLLGESPRIESVAFSPDGKWLAVAGGAPSRFGEIQIWDLTSNRLAHAYKIGNDSLYGVSFSQDGQRVAFGSAEKTVRMIAVNDGKELLKFDNHSDWVFATVFTTDGKRLLTGSRDRAMKLIDASSGQFIDDINKLLDAVLCFARHPKMDQIAYGGEVGSVRIYRISDNQGRTAANNDVNLIRDFERQPGAVHAIAWSPDANHLAVGGVASEVRVYKVADGSRSHTLKIDEGATFALLFNPAGNQLAAAGFDGKVRLFDFPSGQLGKAFIPVPLNEKKIAAGPDAVTAKK